MAPTTTRRSRAGGRAAPRSRRWTSRAVLRAIEPGSSVTCVECGEPVKFRAKVKAQQAICNVYVKGVWDRVEHYHAECYTTAGAPYGEAQPPAATTSRRGAAASAAARPAPAPAA